MSKRWHGLRPGRVSNSFGDGIFGIASAGSLEDEPPRMLAADLNADHAAHARWLRFNINWAEIQRDGPSGYRWRAIDRVVRHAVACGMKPLGVIVYTPSWARPGGTTSTYAPTAAAYAKFAGIAAEHYSRLGVSAFELWNEPNSPAFWQPRPDPAAYTALLKAAYASIKRSDPSATVLTGGLAPAPTKGSSVSPVDFLSAIYAHGGKASFDAVGDHPYCWPAYPGQRHRWSAWYQMYGTHPSLRSVMIADGDGEKKIWATEYGAPTDGPPGSYVSQGKQAKMLIRAYRLFAGYSWAGPLFFYSGRDQGTSTGTNENFFGFLKHNFSPKLSYVAYLAESAALTVSVNH